MAVTMPGRRPLRPATRLGMLVQAIRLAGGLSRRELSLTATMELGADVHPLWLRFYRHQLGDCLCLRPAEVSRALDLRGGDLGEIASAAVLRLTGESARAALGALLARHPEEHRHQPSLFRGLRGRRGRINPRQLPLTLASSAEGGSSWSVESQA